MSREEGHYQVSLRSKSGVVGSPTGIHQAILEALVSVAPGVILKDGPLRFYRTEQDFRVSFTELEEEGPSGYDRLDADDLIEAIRQVLAGVEPRRSRRGRSSAMQAKRTAAPNSKRPAKKFAKQRGQAPLKQDVD